MNSNGTKDCSVVIDTNGKGSLDGLIIYWRKVKKNGDLYLNKSAGTFEMVPISHIMPGQYLCPKDYHLNPAEMTCLTNIPVVYCLCDSSICEAKYR